jgi:hypothetical protein
LEDIPLCEVAELERDPNADTTEYSVKQVLTALRSTPPRYQVLWSNNDKTPEPANYLFDCADTVVDYWQSNAGVKNGRTWARSPTALDTTFHYDEWRRRLLTVGAMRPSEISYVLSVQLVSIRHTTHNALTTGLKSVGFPDDTLFDIWVVPRALYGSKTHAAVPVLQVPFHILRGLVVPVEWESVSPRLTHHVSRIALGQTLVPVFYWHSADQDETWGFPRAGTDIVNGVPLADILRVTRQT